MKTKKVKTGFWAWLRKYFCDCQGGELRQSKSVPPTGPKKPPKGA